MSTTATVQLAISGRDDDPSKTSVATPNVPLHLLCGNCARVMERSGSEQQTKSSGPPIFQLCTIAHLRIYHPACHLCTLLFGVLERNGKLYRNVSGKLKVYIQFYHDQEKVKIGIAETMSTEGFEKGFAATFEFKKYLYSDNGAFEQHIVATDVPRTAHDNLERASAWLQTCSSDHESCRKFHHSTVPCQDQRQSPTRVLEISETSIRLRCDMAYEHLDYLALSHMWGESHLHQIRLVKGRLAEFQVSIPWQELPQIYLEAIHITRQLGYRYLWIDSLCIIQDSKEDWAHEAKRMAIVYGNCICNIAFLFPPGTSSSPRDDPRIWSPCILRRARPGQPGMYIRHQVHTWRRAFPEEQQDWLVQRDWPLFKRAWTFQEYLLSPRTLLYGHKNLMFHCSQVFYDELLGPIASREDTTDGRRGRDLSKTRYFSTLVSGSSSDVKIEQSSLAALRFMLDYTSLIAEYRDRVLSYPTDRTIAFAGIASAYSSLSSLIYLAGLWWEYVPLQLLWFVEQKLPATVRGQYTETFKRGDEVTYTAEVLEEEVYEAPSWSWFAVPIYKYFHVGFLLSEDEPAARRRSVDVPSKAGWEDIYVAQAMHFQFRGLETNEHPGQDAFDKLAGLQLTLNTFTWSVNKDLPANLASCITSFDQEVEWDPHLKYYPDKPSTSPSPPRNGILALIFEFQMTRASSLQRRLAGLVLVPVSDQAPGMWKRAGIWYLKLRFRGVEGNAQELGNRWKGLCLTRDWRTEVVTIV